MLKYLVFLCGGLFAAMMIAGQDHGQHRFGLLNIPETEAKPLAVAAVAAEPVAAEVTEAAFVPDAPVMVDPVAVETTEVAAEAAAADIAPVADEPARILVVNSKSANVREGPGKDFAVVGRLSRGESVLVVSSDDDPEGWSLIRIEGDGVEGYIATRLLSE